MCLSAYTSITVTSLTALACTDTELPSGDRIRVMFSSPGVDCSSDEYGRVEIVVYLMLVVVSLGLPLVFGIILFVGSKRNQLLTPLFIRRYGPLYAFYHIQYYYWGIISIILRTIFAILSVAFFQDTISRLESFIIVNILFTVLQLLASPFARVNDSRFEVATLLFLSIISVLLISTVATGSADGTNSNTGRQPAIGAQVIISALLIVVALWFVKAKLFPVAQRLLATCARSSVGVACGCERCIDVSKLTPASGAGSGGGDTIPRTARAGTVSTPNDDPTLSPVPTGASGQGQTPVNSGRQNPSDAAAIELSAPLPMPPTPADAGISPTPETDPTAVPPPPPAAAAASSDDSLIVSISSNSV